MKRRRVLQSLLAWPAAAPVLYAQKPGGAAVTLPSTGPSVRPAVTGDAAALRPAIETMKLALTSPDQVGQPVRRFFSQEEFAALERLADVLAPAYQQQPSAKDAGAPAFLDFLLDESNKERQSLYRDGLRALQAASKKQFNKPFQATDTAQADTLIATLRGEWSYQPPSDALARFLVSAKADLLQATQNSRQWANSAGRRRGASGSGTYWYTIE